MAVTSDRAVVTQFSGQIAAGFESEAAQNLDSPGQMEIVSLTTGTNTITVPSGGSTCVALTILPPGDNTELITLAGDAGDVGIALHKTDPTSIGLDTTQSEIVLLVSAPIDGVRFIWS